MRVEIYIEGGGDSKDLRARCREAFRRLLERSGFEQNMPRLIACGSRGTAYADFRTANESSHAKRIIFMLIDSEEPMADIERTWKHLEHHERWTRPSGAEDWQVLLMTTCMETWIIADHEALRRHCGQVFQESVLPDLHGLESLPRNDAQDMLAKSTARSTSPYRKGKRSFEYLSRVDPEVLAEHLPSFRRCVRILNKHLAPHEIAG